MIPEISILTSPAKLSIANMLNTTKTRDDIAVTLKITRQDVDKQLKGLMMFGIVERRWFIGYNRLKVEYYLTEIGIKFYADLEHMGREFKLSGRSMFNERLRTLDMDIADGKLPVQKYRDEGAMLEESMKWFSEIH